MQKGVLRNFSKFTGKYLCHSLFSNKVVGLRPATLIKKRPWHRDFPVNFAKFLRTILQIILQGVLQDNFTEQFHHHRRLLLKELI